MSGITSIRAHVLLPPQGRPFLEELLLTGDFEIGGGYFTSPETQASVDDLSRRARGEKKSESHKDVPAGVGENVIANLEGHVMVRDGVSRFANLSAGAAIPVEITGTYNDPHFGIDLTPKASRDK
jgi:hypothetical protein